MSLLVAKFKKKIFKKIPSLLQFDLNTGCSSSFLLPLNNSTEKTTNKNQTETETMYCPSTMRSEMSRNH